MNKEKRVKLFNHYRTKYNVKHKNLIYDPKTKLDFCSEKTPMRYIMNEKINNERAVEYQFFSRVNRKLKEDDLDPNFSNEQATGIIIHEFGHAFGLDHNNTNVNSIMCQTSYGRVVQKVQKVDNDAILSKY